MALKDLIISWHDAVSEFEAKNFRVAKEKFEGITDGNAKICYNMSCCCVCMKDLKGASRNLKAAIGKDSHMAIAHFQLGVSHYKRNRFNKALEDFQRAYSRTRSCPVIDYTQLGLDVQLYTCKIVYNIALCLVELDYCGIALEWIDGALSADVPQSFSHNLSEARDAIKKKRNYKLEEISPRKLFRPPQSMVQNTKKVDYLGKAKVVSAADRSDLAVGFIPNKSPSKKRPPPGYPARIIYLRLRNIYDRYQFKKKKQSPTDGRSSPKTVDTPHKKRAPPGYPAPSKPPPKLPQSDEKTVTEKPSTERPRNAKSPVERPTAKSPTERQPERPLRERPPTEKPPELPPIEKLPEKRHRPPTERPPERSATSPDPPSKSYNILDSQNQRRVVSPTPKSNGNPSYQENQPYDPKILNESYNDQSNITYHENTTYKPYQENKTNKPYQVNSTDTSYNQQYTQNAISPDTNKTPITSPNNDQSNTSFGLSNFEANKTLSAEPPKRPYRKTSDELKKPLKSPDAELNKIHEISNSPNRNISNNPLGCRPFQSPDLDINVPSSPRLPKRVLRKSPDAELNSKSPIAESPAIKSPEIGRRIKTPDPDIDRAIKSPDPDQDRSVKSPDRYLSRPVKSPNSDIGRAVKSPVSELLKRPIRSPDSEKNSPSPTDPPKRPIKSPDNFNVADVERRQRQLKSPDDFNSPSITEVEIHRPPENLVHTSNIDELKRQLKKSPDGDFDRPPIVSPEVPSKPLRKFSEPDLEQRAPAVSLEAPTRPLRKLSEPIFEKGQTGISSEASDRTPKKIIEPRNNDFTSSESFEKTDGKPSDNEPFKPHPKNQFLLKTDVPPKSPKPNRKIPNTPKNTDPSQFEMGEITKASNIVQEHIKNVSSNAYRTSPTPHKRIVKPPVDSNFADNTITLGTSRPNNSDNGTGNIKADGSVSKSSPNFSRKIQTTPIVQSKLQDSDVTHESKKIETDKKDNNNLVKLIVKNSPLFQRKLIETSKHENQSKQDHQNVEGNINPGYSETTNEYTQKSHKSPLFGRKFPKPVLNTPKCPNMSSDNNIETSDTSANPNTNGFTDKLNKFNQDSAIQKSHHDLKSNITKQNPDTSKLHSESSNSSHNNTNKSDISKHNVNEKSNAVKKPTKPTHIPRPTAPPKFSPLPHRKINPAFSPDDGDIKSTNETVPKCPKPPRPPPIRKS